MDATDNRFCRETLAPGQALADVLRAEFTETELYDLLHNADKAVRWPQVARAIREAIRERG